MGVAAPAFPADRVALVVYGATAEVVASLSVGRSPGLMGGSGLTCWPPASKTAARNDTGWRNPVPRSFATGWKGGGRN